MRVRKGSDHVIADQSASDGVVKCQEETLELNGL
jgi:hypothetical protein